MSFIDHLKQWARGDDEDDDELEESATAPACAQGRRAQQRRCHLRRQTK